MATPDNGTGEQHHRDRPASGLSFPREISECADLTLRSQLFEPSSDGPAEADRTADQFYDRLEKLYFKHLAKYAFELWHLTVLLRRR